MTKKTIALLIIPMVALLACSKVFSWGQKGKGRGRGKKRFGRFLKCDGTGERRCGRKDGTGPHCDGSGRVDGTGRFKDGSGPNESCPLK